MTSPSGYRPALGHLAPLFDQVGSWRARVSIGKSCEESEGGPDDTVGVGGWWSGRTGKMKTHPLRCLSAAHYVTHRAASPAPGATGASRALAPN